MSRQVNVVACGGFGANILGQLLERSSYQEQADHVNLFALDTSKANLRQFANREGGDRVQTFLVPDADGSGKHRAENYDPIISMVENWVNTEVQPGIYVLVYSASGGTGAVIGGECHGALIKRGHAVISMILGTDGSIQELENTLKTVKTVKHKATTINKHFTVFYGANRQADGKVSSKAADESFLTALDDLITLGHPEMESLDTKDVQNWIQPPTEAEGNIRLLSIVSRKGDEELEPGEVPISTLSIVSNQGQDPMIIPGTLYSAHGVLPESLRFSGGVDEIQMQIFAGRGAKLVGIIEGQLKNYKKLAEDAAKAAAGDNIKVSDTDKVTDTGTFL